MNSARNQKAITFKAFLKNLRSSFEESQKMNFSLMNKLTISMSPLAELVLYLREDGVGVKAVSEKTLNWLKQFNQFGRPKGQTGRDLVKNDLILACKIIENILSYDNDKLFAVAEGVTLAELCKYTEIDDLIKNQMKFNQRQRAYKPRKRKQNPVHQYILKVALTLRPPFNLDELLKEVARNPIYSKELEGFSYDNIKKKLSYFHNDKKETIGHVAVRRNLKKDPRIQRLMK